MHKTAQKPTPAQPPTAPPTSATTALETASEPSPAKPDKAYGRVGECLWRNTASGIYYAFVKRRGKQFHHSLKTKDRALAERRLAKFRHRVASLSQSKESTGLTFASLAERWLETVKGNMKVASALRRAISIKQLNRILGTLTVRNITPRDCDDWLIKRGKLISASSYNNERDTLKQIFEFARRDGLILDNPADHVPRRKMSKAAIVIPTGDQFRILVKTIREGDAKAKAGADLVELLACSGMRLREATSLLWNDVDFIKGTFTVTGGETGTKNRESRMVPLFPAMQQLLRRLQQEACEKSEWVSPIDSAKRTISRACRVAKLPSFSHHTMRHYFVSNAIEAGVNFKVIANWIGHKDGGVLVAKTYGHLRDAHSFEMAKLMTFSAEEKSGPTH